MQNRNDVVLITGAKGFLGTALLKKFAGRYTLVALDRESPRKPLPFVETVVVDMSSDDSIKHALARVRAGYGERIASVIHLAAYYDLSGEPNPLYEEVNVKGVERLLVALQGFSVEQFVFASTMLVHAPCRPGERINEDSPLQPKWAYPQSKVEAEQKIIEQHGAIPAVILRLAGIYDDWCHAAFIAPQLAAIYERKMISRLYPGDVQRGQSYLHLDDFTALLGLLVERRQTLAAQTTLLAGEPETLSYQQIQDIAGQIIHGEEWKTREIPKAVAKAGAWAQDLAPGEEPFIQPWMVDMADDHYELDLSRVRNLLGWQPERRLRDTLPLIIAHLKAEPERWYRENKLEPPGGGETPAPATPVESAAAQPEPSKGEMHERQQTAAEIAALHAHQASMKRWRMDTLWAHFANIVMGVWLITSPFVLGYGNETEMSASDIASGLAVITLAVLSLTRQHFWAQWANTVVGIWLLFAPLVFWTASPAAYMNATLVGSLVIIFAVLVPPMPGMSTAGMLSDADIPPGWDYSPSSWSQRLPIVAFAFVGFFIARYLAAYQLGHIPQAWDPFFGAGTERIITSEVSQWWLISDAGLGALTYMLEALSGIMGDRRRWRTMPWMIALFGVMVLPLGAVSIFFIIIQPIVIGTWCTLCLIAAAAMVLMIPYSLDELVATAQFMVARWRAGRPFWKTFWHGDAADGAATQSGSEFEQPLAKFAKDMLGGGVNVPWTLGLCVLIGAWLMCTRLIFGTQGAMADSDHLIGALTIVVAVSAWAEVARAVRFVNVLFGAWLIVAPWMLVGATPVATWASVAAGLLLIGLSLPRGAIRQHYGSWDRLIV